MKLDFPLMTALLLLGALLQLLVPPLPLGAFSSKIQLLPAIALYYALWRQWQLAICAGLWAGVLTDAFEFKMGISSTITLFLFALLVLLIRRRLPEGAWFVSGLCGALAMLTLGVTHYCVVFSRTCCAPSFLAYFATLALQLPISAAVAIATVSLVHRLEIAAGCVEAQSEVGRV